MQSHPFMIFPPGHSSVMEKAVRSGAKEVAILSVEEYRVKNGTLRVAEVRVPASTGGTRELTVGAWEGETGCLSTSLTGLVRDRLIAVFDSLEFSPRRGGLAIDSPVTPQPRAPEVVKEIPDLGILSVRPAIASELERVPKARGFTTDAGELFRVSKTGDALLLVTPTAVVTVTPLQRSGGRELPAVARNLRVEWVPRGRAGVVR
jgi:hypothetical protein